jgi:two-component system, chemotaxis family, chemotaxis protein CheY
MVTTEGGKQEVIEALTHGVSSYIIKPFTEDILREKMNKLFGG